MIAMIESPQEYLDNQLPMSTDDIEYINRNKALKIRNKLNYPNDNKSLEVVWDVPICITRNEDRFWISSDEPIRSNNWVVYPSKNGFEFEVMQFLKFNDAVIYALEQYNLWISSHNNKSNKVLDSLMLHGMFEI